MAGGEVPVWAGLAAAGIGAVGVIAGSVWTALWGRSTERERLRQDLELHGARDRLEILEQAISVASAYRERVAAALRSFQPPSEANPDEGAEFNGDGLWRWDTDHTQVVKKHEVAIKLRFGIRPVTENWEVWEWLLAKAAMFCESNRSYAEDPDKQIPDHIRDEAQRWRDSTREALTSFIEAAGGAVASSAQPPTLAGRQRRG